MEWWTHARTVHSYTEVEEYQPITQSHTTRREREENHSHSLLPPTFSLISLSLYKLKHQKFHPAQTFTRACTQTHTHTHCEQDRKINTDHGASCFGPITPLWCRMWGDSWQETLSHSHASQNDKSLSFSHPSIPRARALSPPLSRALSQGPGWWERHCTEGVFMQIRSAIPPHRRPPRIPQLICKSMRYG